MPRSFVEDKSLDLKEILDGKPQQKPFYTFGLTLSATWPPFFNTQKKDGAVVHHLKNLYAQVFVF